MQNSGDHFGRAASEMSMGALGRLYPSRRMLDTGAAAEHRKGHTESPAAAGQAVVVADRGEPVTDEAAHLVNLNRAPAGSYQPDMSPDMQPSATDAVVEEG